MALFARGQTGDGRAVSDLVSFVLVFSLAVTSVGIVSVFGVASLTDVKDTAQADAAERGFVALGDSIGELERTESPIRTSDVSVVDASLAVTTGPTLDIAVGGPGVTETIQLGELAYRTEDATITYAGGGVFRSGSSGVTVVAEPSLRCTDEYAIVSLVAVTGSGSVSGGSARVSLTRSDRSIVFPSDRASQTVTNVSIATTDPRWQRYFDSSSNWTGTGPYTCRTDEVFVRLTTVAVDLE